MEWISLELVSAVVVKGVGRFLPRNVQRFLFGAVGGESLKDLVAGSTGSDFVSTDRDCFLGATAWVASEEDGFAVPSNPRNWPGAEIWLSFRMIKRRRPGAG